MLRNLLKLNAKINYSLFRHTTQVKLFATEQEPQETVAIPTEIKHSGRVTEVLGKYKEQDVVKILTIVNNYSSNELLGYDISQTRANKLVAYRKRNGLLKNLHDIFFVESFGLKVTDKFYQSLLQEPKSLQSVSDKSLRAKTASFITPSMDAEQRTNVNACAAIRIGVNSITWSKVELSPEMCNDPCKLTHWEHHEISEKKLHIHELIQRCLYIIQQIPEADCYIFENPQVAQANYNPGSVDQQNINVQKAQTTAMLGYALAARSSYKKDDVNEGGDNDKKPPSPVIFYVRRLLTARLFRRLVGTERVSAEKTIIDLMRTYYNTKDMEDCDFADDGHAEQIEVANESPRKSSKIKGNVQFPMDLREMFSNAPRVHREFLGQALLLNLAFVRLVLLQDSTSIDKVTRSRSTNDVDIKT